MQLPNQIETISVARAANAVHYEYFATVRQRTGEIRLDSPLWRKAVDEFCAAFEKEDAAFKQYRASNRTSALQEADEERDKLYASLRDAVKAYAAVVFYTNAYFALNPDRREAADLVKRMSEDLDYFRKHAMSDPHKSKKEPQPDGGDAPAETVAAEA